MKGFKFITRALLLGGAIYVLGLLVAEFNTSWGIYDATQVQVQADHPLRKSMVKIYACTVAEDSSAMPPFVLNEVLYDSVVTHNFPFKEDENDFVVLYGDEYYFHFLHYKYNMRGQDEYTVHLMKIDDSLEVEVDIHGSTYDYFYGKMKPVTWDLFPDSAAVSHADSTVLLNP